jgi:hypothetical protein
VTAPRYELWRNGTVLARYKTLNQALLGAVYRSRKLGAKVYVWEAGKRGSDIAHSCLAVVQAGESIK